MLGPFRVFKPHDEEKIKIDKKGISTNSANNQKSIEKLNNFQKGPFRIVEQLLFNYRFY